MNTINLRTGLKTIILVISISISSFKSYSQNISTQLGAIKTNLLFSTDNNPLRIKSQIIIKRGMLKARANTLSESSYAYGYGLQSLHLEFISHNGIEKKYLNRKERGFNKSHVIKFINKNNEIILEKKLGENMIEENIYNNSLFTYSINLFSIPVILLDDTERIDIIKITSKKPK